MNGRWRKSPLMILLEATSVTKLPGGPTEGCHNWWFKVADVMAFEMFRRVWNQNVVRKIKWEFHYLHTSNGTLRRQSTGLGSPKHPVWMRRRLNGSPGLSYVEAGGELLLETMIWVTLISILVKSAYNGPTLESLIPARKRGRSEG